MTLKKRMHNFMNAQENRCVFVASKEALNLITGTKELKLSPNLNPELGRFYELTVSGTLYYAKELKNKSFLLVQQRFFDEVLASVNSSKEVPEEFVLFDLDTPHSLVFVKPPRKERKVSRRVERIEMVEFEDVEMVEEKPKKTKKVEPVEVVKEIEVNIIEPPRKIISEPASGSFIEQSDLQESSIKLSKKFKRLDKKQLRSFVWRSYFFSPDELFSNFLILERESIAEGILSNREIKNRVAKDHQSTFDNLIRDLRENKQDILGLLPTPEEKYQELIEKSCKYQQKTKYFNSHFPFSLVSELNNSHHFWLSISNQYKNVDDFAIQLKNYYSSLNPRQLDRLISKNSSEAEDRTGVWAQLQKSVALERYESKDSSFKKLLDKKIVNLRGKNNELTTYLANLKEQLSKEGKSPETDILYLQTLNERRKVLEDIEKTMRLLEEYSGRIQRFSTMSNFEAKFYLSIFGSNAILSQYDSLVGKTLFELNDQINELVYFQQEIEKVLFEKLSVLHRARKAELKLEFLSQDQELSKLIYQQKEKEKRLTRTEQLKELEIQGSLDLSKFNIQKKIDEEKSKLSRYLDRLKRLDSYSDYEDRSRSLREKKADFNQRIEKYREEIYSLKLKVERIEAQYSSFISSLREEIIDFQKSISNTYSSHLSLLNSSIDKVWKDWTNQGIEYIEKIIARKDKLIQEFSEIIVLNLKKMYSNQDSLLEESRKREKEWERVYREMVDEFKTLGYFLSKPKPSERHHRFLPKMEKSHLSLSPEIEKLIYYKPSLKYTTPKVNELIGLSPKLLNDEEFLVIDQVWAKLTPIQEYRLRQKVIKETQEKDRQRINEVLEKTKEDMNKRLQEKNYKFKQIVFENDYPQETDEEDRLKKLKFFEKSHFHNWKETNFTTSEVRYKFHDMLSNLTKKVVTLKGVESWGNKLNISDKGELEDPELVERLGEWDYFVKSKEQLSLIESCSLSSFKLDETESFALEGESYLSILEAIEERDGETKTKISSIKVNKPSIDDWLNLNLKRYREEKKKMDIVEVKEGLLALEKEIDSLKKASGNYREACEIEKMKREILCNEMKADLEELQKYLEEESKELENMFIELQSMLNLSFEDIGKKLAERRKDIIELKLEKEGSS